MTNLAPATRYYYKIDSKNSSVESFLSPRSPGDETAFAFDVVIDLGVYGENGFTVTSSGALPSEKNKPHKKRMMMMKRRRDVQEANPAGAEPLSIEPELNHSTISRLVTNFDDSEFVLHPGDFGYADEWQKVKYSKSESKDAYQVILEQFYDQLAPISGRKAYMAGPGNHEARCSTDESVSCPQGQNNFTDYRHRFDKTMPTAFPSRSHNVTAQQLALKAQHLSNPPFWYSFEYGLAHIVMMDTETDFSNAPDENQSIHGFARRKNQQKAFLEADLASVDRSVTPWLIAAGHRPWYTTGSEPCKPCQTFFEDLLYRYGVDLAIFGHQHNSQRFYPIYNDVPDPRHLDDPYAPMYIVAGGAGNVEGIRHLGHQPSYTAFAYDYDFAYATVTISNRTRLQVDFIRSATGDVLDSSALHKSHREAFVRQAPSQYYPSLQESGAAKLGVGNGGGLWLWLWLLWAVWLSWVV